MVNIMDKSCDGEKIDVDVCILGSGPAGISLARYLTSKNISVAIVERGGKNACKPKRDVRFGFDHYDGIFNAAAFGLGGTSSLWGGQLVPLLSDEMKMMGDPWVTKNFSEELFENYKIIEKWLGVNQGSYDGGILSAGKCDLKKLIWHNFYPLISKWVPFRRRNLGDSWLKIVKKNTEIFFNQELAGWDIKIENNHSFIKKLRCIGPGHKTTTICGHHFVIAAGALDTPLILQKMMGSALSEKLGIGNFLHDHLSLRIAEIEKVNHKEFELFFSPFFQDQTMRSIRFCMPPIINSSFSDEVLAYCHFVISAPENCGFALIRDLLRALQQKDLVNFFKILIMLPTAFADILRIVWIRYTKNKLALPKNSKIYVNLDFVQPPKFQNKIKLDELDKINIDWSVDKNLVKVVSNEAILHMQDFWKKNDLDKLGNLVPIFTTNSNPVFSNLYDIYHPAGTCATGRVLDSDFRVLGYKNLYVLGAAVFPKLGRSNPTLTIMALSLRLGKLIYAKILKGRKA